MTGTKMAAMAAAVAGMMMAAPAWADAGEITITGEGQVNSAPDMARISLGVTAQGETASVALGQTNEKLNAVLARLQSMGIEARDMQTSGLNLGPRYPDPIEGKPRSEQPAFYEASNGLEVRVRDLSKLGDILDQAVTDGANTFHGLQFALSDPTANLDKARVMAVEDARRKAEMIATAAGQKLGKVVRISESSGYPAPMMARMASAEAMPIAGGEVSYSVNVTVVWELEKL